ncbi:MAG: peptidoglycan DD-metalloendopeptidase family protein [candidate division Zixibacteria bacterium]|nr:peptidoglycan DD-metalloendopeptidase family protein [candidate division Zixibacteria bacterium]
MPRSFLPFLLIGLGLVTVATRADDRDKMIDQKSELETIQAEVNRSQKRLDSLKGEEVAAQRQVSDLDQRITTNQKVIRRLNNQIATVRKNVGGAEDELAQNQDRLDQTRRRYLGDVRHFYLRCVQETRSGLWKKPMAEVKDMRESVYLAALAGFKTNIIDQAASSVSHTADRLDQLTGEQRRVSSLKKDKEVATALEKSRKSKEEKSLDALRRQKMAEGDRMLTLQQAAEEIERVIARLEDERRRKQRVSNQPHPGPSVFATLKGQLGRPFRGKIVVPFGSARDPITNLESFSPGITIKGRPSGPVVAVTGGNVAYVGSLRGYGNFIIINHDDQYYTTYGGLGKTAVKQGEYVPTEAVLAVSGDDGQVKFEIRFGREPLDPVKWIRIDAY